MKKSLMVVSAFLMLMAAGSPALAATNNKALSQLSNQYKQMASHQSGVSGLYTVTWQGNKGTAFVRNGQVTAQGLVKEGTLPFMVTLSGTLKGSTITNAVYQVRGLGFQKTGHFKNVVVKIDPKKKTVALPNNILSIVKSHSTK